MKKLLLSLAIAAALLPLAHADDSVRTAQTILQNAGYYTGSLDGELNAETKAALRRYQIRNQLQPTGELTAETTAALNKEGQNAVAATPESPAAPATPPPVPVSPPVPAAPMTPSVPQAVPGAVQGVPVEADLGYDRIFARTPYEKASVEAQAKTLRKAQMILAERGLYNGVVDGRPNSETEEALFRLQSALKLPRTGRLDIDTLAELHLLPVTKLRHREVRPEPMVPPFPRGAVRGVPVD